MDALKDILQKIGLNLEEAEIFLFAMQYGPVSMVTLSRLTKINRSTLYGKVEKMLILWWLQEHKSPLWSKFSAITVDQVLSLLKKQEQDVRSHIELVEQSKADFGVFQSHANQFGQIKYYNSSQIFTIFFEKIRSAPELYAIFDLDAPLEYYQMSVKEAVEYVKHNKGISKEIVFDSPNARTYKKLLNSEKHQVKILKNVNRTFTDFTLMHNSFFQVVYDKVVLATEIDHPFYYQMQKMIFDNLRDRLD